MERLLKIAEYVSQKTKISIEQMKSRNRKRELVEARQLYCWICSKIIPKSKNSLGCIHFVIPTERMGALINRDHTTFLYSVNNVNNFRDINMSFRNETDDILIECKEVMKINSKTDRKAICDFDLIKKLKVDSCYFF